MFKLFCVSSAWTNSGCTGSQTQQRCTFKATSVLLQPLCQAYQFHWPSWFYWLMGVSRKSDNNSRCNVAYRRFFFYHLLDHGPLYTRITDDRLVKPHHSMFVNVFLMLCVKPDASIARMSLLQIKHFPTIWFSDRNRFESLSINI